MQSHFKLLQVYSSEIIILLYIIWSFIYAFLYHLNQSENNF